ncbi:MFS transporter [Streptomyces sp. NBC_01304]|uniref:MFS transporter n=1 Tax=Streptomyces sp. NBC_01304 TaxID=2903818 RepID=UPI002E155EF5|nr:MFS transporter [Streptomyces sp. NBC_01304]
MLRVPYASRQLAGTLIGRLPTAMAPLAILLGAAKEAGHGSAAGLTAIFLLSNAVGGPVSARFVDRFGQTGTLVTGAALSGVAFISLAVGPWHMGWVLVAVSVAGAARPPLDAALRALWGTGPMMPTRGHRRVALSLDSATQELIYVVGPLLVAALTMAASVSGALLVTAALGLAGTAMVVSTPPSRSWAGKSRPTRRGWLGPLHSPRLRVLYLAMVGVGFPMGALTPLAMEAADRFAAPALSGGLPAVLSVGAALGGLAYGWRVWPGSTDRHLLVLSLAFTLGWLPLAAAGSSTTALAAIVLPGLAMAPLLAGAFVETSSYAPPGHVTEAHALLVAALDVGCALGAAVAGLLPTMALLPAGATAACLVLVTGGRRPAADAPSRPPVAEPALSKELLT